MNHNTDETLFTFKVDDVEQNFKRESRLLSEEKIYSFKVDAKSKIESSSFKNSTKENMIYSQVNGIIGAIHYAFVNHHALKLSVSDFIIMIGQGLGRHMEKYAEELRKEFVSFEGKQTIAIERPDLVYGREDNDWSTIFGQFSEEITKRVHTDLYNVVIDDTSVATKLTRVVSELTMMDIYKQYFDYCTISCGFPKITLKGRPEDWEKLRTKVHKLKELNEPNDRLKLGFWLEHLVPVVDKMVDQIVAKKIDVKFWSNLYKWRVVGGYDRVEQISGWITVFQPYFDGLKENTFLYKHRFNNLENDVAQFQKMIFIKRKESFLEKTWKAISNVFGNNEKKGIVETQDVNKSPSTNSNVNVYSYHKIQDLYSGVSKVPMIWNSPTAHSLKMNLYGGYLGMHMNEQDEIEPVYFYAVVHDE